MPLYAYQCYECGKIQEVIRSVKNRDKSIDCDYCMCILKRIIGPVAFYLKGGGWAKDGYAKKQKPKKEKKE